MPTFPALCQAEGTTRTPRAGSKLVRTATNGQSRLRTLYNSTFEDPVLVFNDLSLADVNAIRTFELDNKGTAFDVYFRPENVVISCFFADPPYTFTPFVTGDGTRYRGQVNLVQE
jgi:hypothetical protein